MHAGLVNEYQFMISMVLLIPTVNARLSAQQRTLRTIRISPNLTYPLEVIHCGLNLQVCTCALSCDLTLQVYDLPLWAIAECSESVLPTKTTTLFNSEYSPSVFLSFPVVSATDCPVATLGLKFLVRKADIDSYF